MKTIWAVQHKRVNTQQSLRPRATINATVNNFNSRDPQRYVRLFTLRAIDISVGIGYETLNFCFACDPFQNFLLFKFLPPMSRHKFPQPTIASAKT
eukprot:g16566.t1